MAEYGYTYRSVSTYSTMRNGTREPAVIKPFVPFIPKSDGSNYSEGAVTRKKIVPVTGRPYDEPTTEKYASSEDESDDERYHQTSPVRSSPRKFDDKFPTKVHQNHEGGHNPQRFGPQPTGTYNGGNKDGHKPIGISPIRNGNYNGTNVYDGDHRPTAVGDPNPPYKEGRKPIGGGRSTHDGYNNGYGGDKEGRKPIGISPIRNDNYDDTNAYDGARRGAPVAVGDPNPYKEVRKPIGGGGIRSSHNNGYGDKAGVKPIGINPIRSNKYDGTNGYGSDHRVTDVGDSNPYKEGRKPIGVGSLMSPHDGYNHGKGYGGDKEARKPIGIGSNIKNDNYDGPNRYGGDHRAAAVGDPNPYKEGRKPIGVDNIRSTHDSYNNGYGGDREGRKPVINNNYDSPNGYGNDYNKKEGYKPIRNGNYGISNRDDKPFGSSSNPKYDDGDNAVNYYNNRSNSNVPKISSNWTAAPRKGTQLSQPIHDIDKAMELLRMEAAKRDQQHSNNDHYYDSPTPGNASPRFTDRTGSGATMRPHGNVNQFPSRPRDSTTRVTFIDDVSDYGDDYYRRDDIGRYGYHDAVIDSREAEKKFRGTRV